MAAGTRGCRVLGVPGVAGIREAAIATLIVLAIVVAIDFALVYSPGESDSSTPSALSAYSCSQAWPLLPGCSAASSAGPSAPGDWHRRRDRRSRRRSCHGGLAAIIVACCSSTSRSEPSSSARDRELRKLAHRLVTRRGTRFTGADISGVDFTGTLAAQADATDATLEGAVWERGRPTHLSGGRLASASLEPWSRRPVILCRPPRHYERKRRGSMVSWQSSSTVDDVQNALTSANVTGWDVVAAIVVLVASWPVGIFVRRLTRRALKRVPNLPEEVVNDGARVARWFVFFVALAWALSILGVGVGWVTIIVVVLLVFGVLMLKPMVENTAAGLLLTIRPVYNVGDQIETIGYEGTVTSIASRSTVLRRRTAARFTSPTPKCSASQSWCTPLPLVARRASTHRRLRYRPRCNHRSPHQGGRRRRRVLDNPAPSVQASAIHDNTITLSISYWYPSSKSSGSSATDGAIRRQENDRPSRNRTRTSHARDQQIRPSPPQTMRLLLLHSTPQPTKRHYYS